MVFKMGVLRLRAHPLGANFWRSVGLMFCHFGTYSFWCLSSWPLAILVCRHDRLGHFDVSHINERSVWRILTPFGTSYFDACLIF